MKIRNGFVSNSSSSSFCIYGVYFDESKIFENLKEEVIEKIIKEEDITIEELKDSISEYVENFVDVVRGEDRENIYIGREWKNIGDDETGKQFKQSVQDNVMKIFKGNLHFDTYEEGWFEG